MMTAILLCSFGIEMIVGSCKVQPLQSAADANCDLFAFLPFWEII